MDGEILRGEVYWVCLDDSVGYEEKTGRPGVVISANGLNEKEGKVTIAYTSKQGFALPTCPSIVDPQGGRMRVLCDQLRTVDKSRLSRYMFTLEKSELIRVTGALACALCIPVPKNDSKSIPPENDDKITSLRCEADMWRRMYEKVMDQLVEIRVASDNVRKEKTVVKSALVEPDAGYEDKVVPTKKPKKEKSTWNGIKVNVNTVSTADELTRLTGICSRTAGEIVRTRKIVGPYKSVEDLLALESFGKIAMKRYGHMLEV